ncbi:PREDICTED: clathrin light chain 2-like [Ipomoea nil]|uniref:clathrin light chain 2-like n=1 Tax=Ipomoea nil TaxID=35883 RepID=UPI00090104B0|nr:PREDICTED: clathrin light chain 2-like [Ipomoea nil]
MSSSFNDAFYQFGADSPNASNPPFHDGFLNPPADDGSRIYVSPPAQHTSFPPPIYASGDSDPEDEKPFVDAFATPNAPVLPPPSEMQEEGFALREWRRQNALQLEEKEKREKEVLSQIIDEADGYKVEFYKKREVKMEANKATCREKEKIFLASHEKFHAEADKHYWKAISELIPNEVPTIVKKGKKDQEKKPSIAVIQGPKPGKPTELSRMRQILLKLKHDTPLHLKPSPSPTATEDANIGTATPAAAVTTKPVAVA